MSKKVLIVDDSPLMRILIRKALTDEGYQIIDEASNGEQAIDMVLELEPDLIMLDNILPDMAGFDVLRALKEEGIKAKVVIVSALEQKEAVEGETEFSALAYVVKPFTSKKLIEVVNGVMAV